MADERLSFTINRGFGDEQWLTSLAAIDLIRLLRKLSPGSAQARLIELVAAQKVRTVRINPEGESILPEGDLGLFLYSEADLRDQWGQQGPQEQEPKAEAAHALVLKALEGTTPKSGAGRPSEYDWDEAKQFFEREYGRRGDPRKPDNQVNGWRSITDAAQAVMAHLERHEGKSPDESTARRRVSSWLDEFEKREAEQSAHN